jgi:hypothetical protein
MRTEKGRTVDGMHPISRRTTLQTGLAAVGVLSAVAISLGLADNTHTNAGVQGTPARQQAHDRANRSESDDEGAERSNSTPSSSPSVSAPQPSPPQATTSGS